MARGGIFCLEGQWQRDLHERGSVLPTLELLDRLERARFIYKDVGTQGEFGFFINRWLLRQYDDFRVGFFAMHGEPGRLWLTDWHPVELNEAARIMAGRGIGKRLYFASCSVLKTAQADLQDFLSATHAEMLCG